MKSSDKSNLIIEEANGIIDSLIKKKAEPKIRKNKIILLSILTMSLAVFLIFVIRFI